MDPQPGPWAAFYLLPVFWVLASYGLALIGGWSSLASTYRANALPRDGFVWRGQSGRMRFATNYGGCLTIAADQHGLYLAVFPLFRLGHPPLFIPWNQISAQQTRGWLFRYVTLSFRDEAGVSVTVREKLAREVFSSVGQTARIEPSV